MYSSISASKAEAVGFGSVIVICKDESRLRLTAEALSSEYDVIPSESPDAVFASCTKGDISAVIVDTEGADDISEEYFTQVAARAAGCGFAVLIIVGDNDEKTHINAVTSGLQNILSRPFSDALLLCRVKAAIAALDNIAERRDLEALRVTLNDIVSNVPAGLAIHELREDGLYPRYVSDKMCALFGYSREEFNKSVADGNPIHFLPETKILSNAELEGFFDGKKPIDVVIPSVRKDGSGFWLRVVSDIATRPGLPPLLYSTLFDVSSQHEGEEELSVLLRSINGGILKYAAEGEEIAYASETLSSMLGYTHEEFLNRHNHRVSELICQEDRAETLALIEKQANSAAASGMIEYRMVMKDGGLKWVYVTGHMVVDPTGRKWYYGVVVDAEERKRLEEELEKKSRQNEAIIANIPGGAATLEIEGGVSRCVSASDGLYKLLGYAKGEISSPPEEQLSLLVHPEDLQKVTDCIKYSILDGSKISVDFRTLCKSGSYLWLNLRANLIPGSDGIQYLYCSFTDISEHIRREQELYVQSQQMKVALRSSSISLWDYSIAQKTFERVFTLSDDRNNPDVMHDVPGYPIREKIVAPESAEEYLRLHEAVARGEKSASAIVRMRSLNGSGMDWYRIAYYTLFSDGKPIGAVGSAQNISMEVAARARAAETALALDASSLYFWTYEKSTRELTCVSKSAESFLSGINSLNIKDWIEKGAVMSESVGELTAFTNKLRSDDITDGQILLRFNSALMGVEWMKLSYSTVSDSTGTLRSVVITGEDVSEMTKKRLDYEREIEKVRSLGDGLTYSKMYTDLTQDRVEEWRSPIACPGVSYTQAASIVIDRIYTDGQKQAVRMAFSRAKLLSDFAAGIDTHEISYQIMSADETYPRWCKCVMKVFRDRNTGSVKLFLYATDIDAEVVTPAIFDTVMKKVYELLAVIYVKSGRLRCYSYSEFEKDLNVGIDSEYSAGITEFIDKYISKGERGQARRLMSLRTVARQLDKEPSYSFILTTEYGGKALKKKWTYLRFGEDGEFYIVTRSDATEEEAARLKAEEMRLAVIMNKTIVCRYSIKDRVLTIPEEFAKLTQKPITQYDVPYESTGLFNVERKAYVAFYERMLRGEMRGDADFDMTLPDSDEPHHIRASFITQFDGDKPVDAIITFRDISEQYKAEVENSRSRLVIENCGICVYDYDICSDSLHYETFIEQKGIVGIDIPHYLDYLSSGTSLDPEDAKKIQNAIHNARVSTEGGIIEFRADLWGNGKRWAKLHYVCISDTDGKTVRMIGQASDIQAQKEREVISGELTGGRNEPLYESGVVAEIFDYLSSSDDTNGAINRVIDIIGRHFGFTRIIISEIEAKNDRLDIKYEWGVTKVDTAQSIPYSDNFSSEFEARFNSSGVYICPTADELPKPVRDKLKLFGIKTVLQCALYYNGIFSGFIGFGSAKTDAVWDDRQVGTLSMISRCIGLYIFLRRERENSMLAQRQLSDAVANIPGGLYCMNLTRSYFSYLSNSLAALVGISLEELQSLTTSSIAELVYPPDLPGVLDMFARLKKSPSVESREYRLLLPGGGTLWINMNVRSVRLPDGDIYAYASITPAQKEHEAREQEHIYEEAYRIAVGHAKCLVCRYDIASATMYIPDDIASLYHLPPVCGGVPMSMIDKGFISRQSANDYIAFIGAINEGTDGKTVELLRRMPGGGHHWFRGEYTLIRTPDGVAVSAVVTYTDIEKDKEKDAEISALKENEQLMRIIFAHLKRYILKYDLLTGELTPYGINVKENNVSLPLLPRLSDYFDENIFTKDSIVSAQKALEALAAGNSGDIELCAHINETQRWYQCTYSAILDENGKPSYAIISAVEVTREHNRRAELLKRAQYDFVTGAYNRAVFIERFNDATASGVAQGVFAMLDADKFKLINDTCGHAFGDRRLFNIAEQVRKILDDGDFIGRFGGDEFAFVLLGKDAREAEEKLRYVISALTLELSDGVHASVSVGICVFPRDGDTFGALYEKADIALYRAKNGGCGFAVYDDTMADEKGRTGISLIDPHK